MEQKILNDRAKNCADWDSGYAGFFTNECADKSAHNHSLNMIYKKIDEQICIKRD